jgi:hypothetical protein
LTIRLIPSSTVSFAIRENDINQSLLSVGAH